MAEAWTAHVVKMMEEATGETLRAPGFDEVIQTNNRCAEGSVVFS